MSASSRHFARKTKRSLPTESRKLDVRLDSTFSISCALMHLRHSLPCTQNSDPTSEAIASPRPMNSNGPTRDSKSRVSVSTLLPPQLMLIDFFCGGETARPVCGTARVEIAGDSAGISLFACSLRCSLASSLAASSFESSTTGVIGNPARTKDLQISKLLSTHLATFDPLSFLLIANQGNYSTSFVDERLMGLEQAPVVSPHSLAPTL